MTATAPDALLMAQLSTQAPVRAQGLTGACDSAACLQVVVCRSPGPCGHLGTESLDASYFFLCPQLVSTLPPSLMFCLSNKLIKFFENSLSS